MTSLFFTNFVLQRLRVYPFNIGNFPLHKYAFEHSRQSYVFNIYGIQNHSTICTRFKWTIFSMRRLLSANMKRTQRHRQNENRTKTPRRWNFNLKIMILAVWYAIKNCMRRATFYLHNFIYEIQRVKMLIRFRWNRTEVDKLSMEWCSSA